MARRYAIWLWIIVLVAAGCGRAPQTDIVATAVAGTVMARTIETAVAGTVMARAAATVAPPGPTVILQPTAATAVPHRTTPTRPADRLAASPTPSAGPLAEARARCLPWNEARNYEGRTECVCGPVVDTYYASRSNGAPTFLNLGAKGTDPNRFTVLIWGEYRANFDPPPELAYRNKTICVTGRIRLYRGVPEIQVKSPAEIEAE
ncbi:MAG: hypothetical protein N2439_11320 [Anaerolineae bacterium]|nr:hypothetical protein [Anaerolineae bacterium]